jgi:hypothetical protein
MHTLVLRWCNPAHIHVVREHTHEGASTTAISATVVCRNVLVTCSRSGEP